MLVFKGAKIYPVVGDVLQTGFIKVNARGKIAAISPHMTLAPDDHVVDLSNKVILPGLVDCHSHVGMWGDGDGPAGQDGNESVKAISGEVRALDSVNPRQLSFESAREGGITSIQVLPGSGNPIGGLAFACKTAGDIIDEMVLKQPTGLKGAMGENPKMWHGSHDRAPATRMAIAAMMRQYFAEAKRYGEEKQRAQANHRHFRRDLNLESGLLVLNKEIPFRVHAHRHDDIVSVVRLCNELKINYSIEHCTDGHKIADFLADQAVTAMIGPGLSAATKLETADITDANAGILAKAGVTVCLMTDHPFLNCKYFLHYGAVAHKYGLSFDDTLKAITLNPARAIGIADRVGSLEVGKDADFIVLNAEPFSYRGYIEQTYIEGKCVWTRQDLTALYS